MISIKQRWSILFIILLVVVYGVIFYIQKGEEESGEIEIYFADRVTAAHKILIDKYNQIMKGKVKVVPIDFPNFDFSTNERKEVLARSLRGMGDGIDLYAVDIIWVQRFAKWSEPFDKYFSEEEKNRILPQALASCYSDGELVAVPLNLVQGIMYYRKDLVEKLKNGKEIINKIENNITWEEFIKIRTGLNIDKPFYIFRAAVYEGFICSFMELLLGQNPDYFEEYGFNLEKPEAEKALQLLYDLISKYKMTPPIVTKFTEIQSYQYFIKNDGLFLHGWPSFDKDFKDVPIDTAKENKLSKTALPYFRSGRPASITGGWHLMMSKFSDKKNEVVDFVKFLLSDESQEIIYRESGHYPVVKKIFYDPYYEAIFPQIFEVRKLIQQTMHRPFHPEYTRYSKIMSTYFEQVLKNQITVKQALKKVSDSIQLEKSTVKEF